MGRRQLRPSEVAKPMPKSIGKPIRPRHLNKKYTAGQFWEQYVPRLLEMGIGCEVDTAELTALCEFWADYRDARERERSYVDSVAALAESIHELADAIRENGCDEELAEAALARIDQRVKQSVSIDQIRNQQLATKRAYEIFSKISARFGLAPFDRQKLAETAEATKESALDTYLKKRMTMADGN